MKQKLQEDVKQGKENFHIQSISFFFCQKKTSASASYTPQEAAWSGAGTLTASRKHTGFISHPLPHFFCRAYEHQGGGTVTVFKEYGCHMN